MPLYKFHIKKNKPLQGLCVRTIGAPPGSGVGKRSQFAFWGELTVCFCNRNVGIRQVTLRPDERLIWYSNIAFCYSLFFFFFTTVTPDQHVRSGVSFGRPRKTTTREDRLLYWMCLERRTLSASAF